MYIYTNLYINLEIYNKDKLYMLTYVIYGLYTNRQGFLFDNRSRQDMKALVETQNNFFFDNRL